MESNMEQRGMQAGEKGIGREETGELDRLFLDLPPREAYPLILAKAWEGSGRALLLLALYLDGGYGTFFLDQGQARVYASAASQVGDPVAPAFCALKDLPNVGESVRVFVRQREKIRALAAEGDFLAQYYLGIMYAYGEGEDPSYEDALAWFEQSAAQGFAAAQLAMGSFLRLVDGEKMAAGGRCGWDGIEKLQQKAMQKPSSAWPRNTGCAAMTWTRPGSGTKEPPARSIPLPVRSWGPSGKMDT